MISQQTTRRIKLLTVVPVPSLRICTATAALLCLLLIAPCSMALDITITGVDEDTRRNMLNAIGQPANESPRVLKKFIEQLPKNANKAMQSIGYYNVAYNVENVGSPKAPALRVAVIAGQSVKISRLVIQILNDAQVDGGYMPVIGQIPLRGNSTFTHADYENTKALLINAALDRGYFNYKFTTSGVRISRTRSTAEITLIADSGPRYTFGDVKFKSDYFSDDFLQNYLPFKRGDFYESSLLASLTQQMQNTGFFSKVRVMPQRDLGLNASDVGTIETEAEKLRQVPLIIEVERKLKNYVGIGIGYETDTEGRIKLTWSKPVVNKAGHSFDSELGLSKVKQNLSFQYRIPRDKDPLNNYWSIEYGLQNLIVDDTSSFLSTLNLQRVKRTKKDWRESFFVRWERDTYVVASEKDRTDLVLPGFSYSKKKSRGQLFPTRGYNINFQFLYGSRELLSDIDLYKIIFNYKFLRSFADLHTVIASVQYGAISSNNFDDVPPSQRFFAGGDRTIRGFPFRSISPLNADGEAVGGRYLEVLSAEYNYRFAERWAVALFVDTGRAFDDVKAPFEVGTGFGLRWFSPVGPFRVDIAFDASKDDPDLGFHLSLGPDL